ncbi:hypothetical protein [Photobacterium damselae]|uniref:hypothetical protein n=1 Tax=Photobacterium damselae TaxID=38293 RepID=UPI001F2950B5|nr:hypothetical protein [Photobacterium damselae]UKA04851.1 hypothetical protein IHC89_21650 [Photobacterium damselae subsp. damselae]
METKPAFVILSGGGERTPCNIYNGISFSLETAKQASKGLGFMGSDGDVRRVLTIVNDNETIILGEWGTIGHENTLKIRPVSILKEGASPKEIAKYFLSLKKQDRLSKILTSLSDDDVDLLKTYLLNGNSLDDEPKLSEPMFTGSKSSHTPNK